ncbi:hypothetical protein [Cellvibrio sp. pealriver]|nr:hypothetical protein [Cellvibrio sp. pealriver]
MSAHGKSSSQLTTEWCMRGDSCFGAGYLVAAYYWLFCNAYAKA